MRSRSRLEITRFGCVIRHSLSMADGTRMAGKLVENRVLDCENRIESTMPPNDSRGGARAGAQRGVSRLEKIMSAFMWIP
ncbi:hypothetical protein D3C79_1065430 [compost metagenome]